MSADIENMVLTRAPAWHGWPVLREEALTFEEVLREVPQLGAHVRSKPLYYRDNDGNYVEVEGHVANVRDPFATITDYGVEDHPQKLVGVVTDSYTLAQTRHQAAMLDELVGAGELKYETAMSLNDGRRHAILARLPEDVEVAGDIVEPYIFCANSFDGSMALSWAVTPIRIVCSNTLRWAMQDATRRGSIYTVSHIGSVTERVEKARDVLGFTKGYVERLRERGERLADFPMTGALPATFLERLAPMPTPTQIKASADGGASLRVKASEVREIVRTIVAEAPDLAEHRENGWGYLNAVVEYEDHYRSSKGEQGPERRLNRITLGERKLVDHADKVLAAMMVPA